LNISIESKLSFSLKKYDKTVNSEYIFMPTFESTESIYRYVKANKYNLDNCYLFGFGKIILQFDHIATLEWIYADDDGWGSVFRSFNNVIKGVPYSYLSFSFKQNLHLPRYIITHNTEEIEIVQDSLHIVCPSKNFYLPLHQVIYNHYEPLNRLAKEGYLRDNVPLYQVTKSYMVALEKMKKSMKDLGWL
jgi:hypothetical protein